MATIISSTASKFDINVDEMHWCMKIAHEHLETQKGWSLCASNIASLQPWWPCSFAETCCGGHILIRFIVLKGSHSWFTTEPETQIELDQGDQACPAVAFPLQFTALPLLLLSDSNICPTIQQRFWNQLSFTRSSYSKNTVAVLVQRWIWLELIFWEGIGAGQVHTFFILMWALTRCTSSSNHLSSSSWWL